MEPLIHRSFIRQGRPFRTWRTWRSVVAAAAAESAAAPRVSTSGLLPIRFSCPWERTWAGPPLEIQPAVGLAARHLDLTVGQFPAKAMKRFLITLLSMATLGGVTLGQPIPLYQNFGTLTNVPTIDALAFANYGSFDVFKV